MDQLGAYDTAYPAGNLVTNALIGQTVYVRATASDPFGAYDVTSLDLLRSRRRDHRHQSYRRVCRGQQRLHQHL